MLQSLALKLIRFYQNWLSFDQGNLFKPLGLQICRHQPFCSEYTYQAIQKHGILKGTVMGTWRILKCNPFTQGGYDPVK